MLKLGHKYYGCAMTHADVKARAEQLVKVLPDVMKSTGAEAVIVTGVSGMSIGFAALALLNFPLFVVRKQNDMSHGSVIEGPQNVAVTKYLVLDDFVSSGRTIRTIAEAVTSARGTYADAANPEGCVCVGVLMHDPEAFVDDTSKFVKDVGFFGNEVPAWKVADLANILAVAA